MITKGTTVKGDVSHWALGNLPARSITSGGQLISLALAAGICTPSVNSYAFEVHSFSFATVLVFAVVRI